MKQITAIQLEAGEGLCLPECKEASIVLDVTGAVIKNRFGPLGVPVCPRPVIAVPMNFNDESMNRLHQAGYLAVRFHPGRKPEVLHPASLPLGDMEREVMMAALSAINSPLPKECFAKELAARMLALDTAAKAKVKGGGE